jgi:chemotaxis protein histidine kinase CheA
VTDISFPPLEPFGAAEQEPPPAIPKFADAFTASEEPETTEAKEEEAAPPVTAEAPPEQAPEEGKEAPQPVAEAPRSIAMPEIEEKSAAVAPPEEAPQPRRSAPPVDDTSEMAEQLTGFLQDMGRQLRESREGQRQAEEQLARLQAQHDDIRRRLQDSEDALSARSQRLQNVQDELRAAQTDLQDARATIAAKQEKLDAVRNALSEVPSLSVPQDQMDELQGLIESLVQNPNHVEYLAQTAKRASLISSVVQEASGLRTLVTRLNEQVASD